MSQEKLGLVELDVLTPADKEKLANISGYVQITEHTPTTGNTEIDPLVDYIEGYLKIRFWAQQFQLRDSYPSAHQVAEKRIDKRRAEEKRKREAMLEETRKQLQTST